MAFGTFKPGDNWIVDDVTGLRVRSSKARTQWDGTVVDRKYFTPRHPQESVRGRRDDQSVDINRPEPPELITGPLATTTVEAASAGDFFIRVTSTAGMQIGDAISFILATGDTCRAIIAQFYASGYLAAEDGSLILSETGDYILWIDPSDSEGVIGFSVPLPEAVLSGATVIDNTVMAEASLP